MQASPACLRSRAFVMCLLSNVSYWQSSLPYTASRTETALQKLKIDFSPKNLTVHEKEDE